MFVLLETVAATRQTTNKAELKEAAFKRKTVTVCLFRFAEHFVFGSSNDMC